MVQMKNRVSGLLMETGVEYNKQRLHKVGYFRWVVSPGKLPEAAVRQKKYSGLSNDTHARKPWD
jgi:hypothetical protein